MKKNIKLSIISLLMVFLFSCSYKQNNDIQPIIQDSNGIGLTESEAKIIAEQECIKGGESLSPGYYNENSKTWWFDANLNSTKEGCNPACVVFETTKKAEINWRCTGLINPEESTNDILTKLFAEKYPKYADTIIVNISKKTQKYARGGVIFELGKPGGNFLAARIDGDWQIIFDGNGQISCELLKYGFPDDMLSDCSSEKIVEEPIKTITCIDEDEGIPVITSISANSGTVETKLEINGCNFSGFEGDKHVWIENEKGIKGLLYGEEGSTSKQINITLKSPLCQFDTSYSGLDCDSWLELVPGKYKIYVMPWGKISNKVDFTISPSEITNNLSYQDIIDYIDKNITEIINTYSKIKPANGKWFVDGYGFTSINNVYVDYEDGHYLYRALLECYYKNNIFLCNPLAIFENKERVWVVIEGEDTQKNNSIIYKWAKDYEWKK